MKNPSVAHHQIKVIRSTELDHAATSSGGPPMTMPAMVPAGVTAMPA